jgi:hypothetical protein
MRLSELMKLLAGVVPKGYGGVKNHGLFFHTAFASLQFGADYFRDTRAYEQQHSRDAVQNFTAGSRRKHKMTFEMMKRNLQDSFNKRLACILRDLDLAQHPNESDEIVKNYAVMCGDKVADTGIEDDITWRAGIKKGIYCLRSEVGNILTPPSRKVHNLMTSALLQESLQIHMTSSDFTDNKTVKSAYEHLLQGIISIVIGTLY